MIRMNKLTDYSIILLTHMAKSDGEAIFNSRDLADATNLPQPMVSKILKALAREGILISHRGVKGGYSLSRGSESITVAEIITAIEGPISIAECTGDASQCGLEICCPVRPNWQKINLVMMESLEKITLWDMANPAAMHHVTRAIEPIDETESELVNA